MINVLDVIQQLDITTIGLPPKWRRKRSVKLKTVSAKEIRTQGRTKPSVFGHKKQFEKRFNASMRSSRAFVSLDLACKHCNDAAFQVCA